MLKQEIAQLQLSLYLLVLCPSLSEYINALLLNGLYKLHENLQL